MEAAKEQAEATVSSMPKVVSRTEHAALRTKYEDTYQKNGGQGLTGAQHPQELVRSDRRFMRFTEFVSREDADVAPVGAVVDHSMGTRRGHAAIGDRGACLMCAFRYPNKAAFQRITPNIFSRYANRLVGGARLRPQGQGRQGPQHGAALVRAVAILRAPGPQSRHQEGQQRAQLGGLSGGGQGGHPGEGALPDHSAGM